MTEELKQLIRVQLAKMNGWCSEAKAFDLCSTVIEMRPETVVEIGVFAGKSLICIAHGLRHNQRGRVYGIDPWEKGECMVDEIEANKSWWASVDIDGIYAEAQRHVSENAFSGYVTLMRESSASASKFFGCYAHIDILHIDGNHSEWTSTHDVAVWIPRVKNGGMIFMDDVNWPSTETARKLLAKRCELLRQVEGVESTYAVYKKLW